MATSGRCVSTASASPDASGHGRADLDARLGEQPGQALAQQHGVVGDHDPHGSSASTSVPWGWFSLTRKVPRSADTRSARPCSPLPCGLGAADSPVGDEDAYDGPLGT